MICKECRHPWELHRNGVGCLVEGCPCGVDADESAHAWERPMTDNTEREALIERIESAISLAFEGEGEAWSDNLSGDRLAAVAARAIEPVLAAHDKRVRSEQRETDAQIVEDKGFWNDSPGHLAAAIREASDD